jgi:restriction system protein
MSTRFFSTLSRVATQVERQRAAQERAIGRELKRREIDLKRLAKEEKSAYYASRLEQCKQFNNEVSYRIDALGAILTKAVSLKGEPFDLNKLKQAKPTEWSLRGNSSLELPPQPPPAPILPPPPRFFARLLLGSRTKYRRQCDAARDKHEFETKQYTEILNKRIKALSQLTKDADTANSDIDELIQSCKVLDTEAIEAYFSIVLERINLPEGFEISPTVVYHSKERHLLVETEAPSPRECISYLEKYKYAKATDTIEEIPRAERSARSLYTDVVSNYALRYLHEIMVSDSYNAVDIASLNVYVSSIDRSIGRTVRPCIISIRVSKDEFLELDLANVDPKLCLKRLRAIVSQSPSELVAVKPVFNIMMIDERFIAGVNVISEIDHRRNLMDLTPSEFEALISNLFQQMGLDTKLTRASRDGGVDCVAFDPRPVLGGKVIVQAKRYKNIVGVSAVRDLFGAVHNEGASKGILVTTSHFGKAAFGFANGKPLELINGANLLYLLKEHAGVEAKIEMPEDWQEPSHPED